MAEEKPFYIIGGRRWKNEIALLVENKHNIPKVTKLLGRGKEACRQQLKRLGIQIKKCTKKYMRNFSLTRRARSAESL